MAQEEHQAIYDFLYKDLVICNSLYSQFFRGLLRSTKNATESTLAANLSGEASIPGIAVGSYAKSDGSTLRLEESLDPHDIIVLETIAKLAPSAKRVGDELLRGDIVVVTGDLYVFNRPQVNAALDAFEQIMPVLPKGTPNKKQTQAEEARQMKAGIGLVRSMMTVESTDARYIMISEGVRFSGTLKESALTSSLESLAFSFSGVPISPITLFGIVERPAFKSDLPASPFDEENINGMMNALSRSLSTFGLNSDKSSPVIKPIAIYSPLNI